MYDAIGKREREREREREGERFFIYISRNLKSHSIDNFIFSLHPFFGFCLCMSILIVINIDLCF